MTWVTVKEGEHKGTAYQVGYYKELAGIRWRIPYCGHSAYRMSGAFYDNEDNHPEGAIAWAEADVCRYIDKCEAYR